MKKGIISRNISLLMEHFGIRNESQFAKQVGMPQTTINKLITGVSADPRISTLVPIIEYFKISLDMLLNDNPIFTNAKKNKSLDLLVPLVSYDELVDVYANLNSLTIENWPHWYPLPRQNSSNYYAVYLNSGYLSEPFHQASLLIIKNDLELSNSVYCLVKHLDSNTINLKKVFFDNGKQLLLALNAAYSVSEFDIQHWQLLGTVQAFITNVSNNNFTFIKK